MRGTGYAHDQSNNPTLSGSDPLFVTHPVWVKFVARNVLHAPRPFPRTTRLHCDTDSLGTHPVTPSEHPGKEFHVCRVCLKALRPA